MAGIFPSNGLAPGDRNSGVALTNPVDGCSARYYNEQCAQRIDPVAFNFMISELVAIMNLCPGFEYDCSRRDNVARAIQCLGISPTDPEDPCTLPFTNSAVFNHTGSVQTFTVPSGVSYIRVKCWGGAGGHPFQPGVAGGGPGGYTMAVIEVTPGEVLNLVVGNGGHYSNTSNDPGAGYGYGGTGAGQTYAYPVSQDDEWGTGGGLAGVFRGSVSQANALVIAGGGGGANDDETSPHVGGQPGNGTGGESGMSGGNAALTYKLSEGGGGGGYNGGSAAGALNDFAKGGTGYVKPGSFCATILSSAMGSKFPPNMDFDHDGAAGIAELNTSTLRNGTGRIVIRY